MKTAKFILLFVFSSLLLPPFVIAQETNNVVLYFFWGEGCSHCTQEKPFLEGLADRYPQLEVRSHETWYNKKNSKLYSQMAEAFGTKRKGVPATFIGDKVWIGYRNDVAQQIENKVKHCIEYGCTDPIERLKKPFRQVEISELPATVSPANPVCVHVFLRRECPQCKNVIPHLDSLTEEYNVELTRHDVSTPEEKELYEIFKKTYGFKYRAYPTVFIGDRVLTG